MYVVKQGEDKLASYCDDQWRTAREKARRASMKHPTELVKYSPRGNPIKRITFMAGRVVHWRDTAQLPETIRDLTTTKPRDIMWL